MKRRIQALMVAIPLFLAPALAFAQAGERDGNFENPVPEPSAALVMAVGLATVALARRRS